MSLLEKIPILVKRHLWRCREGFLYTLVPEQTDVDRDQHEEEARTLQYLSEKEIHSTKAWTELDASEVRRRLQNDHRCLGYIENGEVIYLEWICPGPSYIRGADLLLLLGKREWYGYGVMTKPSAQGQGLYQSAQRQLVRLAREEKIHKLIAYVEVQNPIPQKIYPRLNYQITKKIVSRRLFGLHLGNCYHSTTGQLTRHLTNRVPKQHNWI